MPFLDYFRRAPAQPEASSPRVRKQFNAASIGKLIQSLVTGTPGLWGGSHAKEAEQFTGWHFVCISQLANQISQAAVQVFQASGPTTRRKGYGDDGLDAELLPPEHPLCKILLRPNPYQTGGDFRYEQVLQLRLTGCCFVWNVPNKAGRTVQRYVLPTAAMTPAGPSPEIPNGGWRVDRSCGAAIDEQGFRPIAWQSGGPSPIIPAEQVQVIGYPHPTNKADFQSPVGAGATWTDTANAVAVARHAQMANSGNPSLWLKEPADSQTSAEEAEAIVGEIRKAMAGASNNRKVMFGRAGLDAKVLNQSAADMDYIGGHLQSRDSILALHHTPALVVGAEVPGTLGAVVAAQQFYIWATVRPVATKLADADTAFLAPQFGAGLSVWLELPTIDDPEQLERSIENDLACGLRTRNELRALRGLPPDPGPAGNEYLRSSRGTERGQPVAVAGEAKAHRSGPREYLPEGAHVPATIEEALGVVAESWDTY